jgi:hypothetical protein
VVTARAGSPAASAAAFFAGSAALLIGFMKLAELACREALRCQRANEEVIARLYQAAQSPREPRSWVCEGSFAQQGTSEFFIEGRRCTEREFDDHCAKIATSRKNSAIDSNFQPPSHSQTCPSSESTPNPKAAAETFSSEGNK